MAFPTLTALMAQMRTISQRSMLPVVGAVLLGGGAEVETGGAGEEPDAREALVVAVAGVDDVGPAALGAVRAHVDVELVGTVNGDGGELVVLLEGSPGGVGLEVVAVLPGDGGLSTRGRVGGGLGGRVGGGLGGRVGGGVGGGISGSGARGGVVVEGLEVSLRGDVPWVAGPDGDVVADAVTAEVAAADVGAVVPDVDLGEGDLHDDLGGLVHGEVLARITAVVGAVLLGGGA